jgi:hypothetical protein
VAFDRAPGERLSRYIVERSHIRPSNQTVKYNAFMPPSHGRLSVFQTTGLVESDVWQLGHEYVAPARRKPILARADLNSLTVYEEDLTVVATPTTHPRHTDITGWDMSTRTRLQATKLAAASRLIMLPGP